MPSFENVREQLLLAGIAPRHVRRYITELREHLADLTAQERGSGQEAAQAEERARILVGSDAQLAEAMIKSAPRSLAARAPWSVFAVLPVVLLLAVMIATAFSMMQLLLPVRDLAPSALPAGYHALIAAVSFFTSYLLGPLLAGGCIVVALRQRLASRWVWVGLALVALVSGPLGLQMHFIPSSDGAGGSTIFSAARIVYQHGHPDFAATWSAALLRAAILFAAATIAYRLLQSRFRPVRA